MPPMGFFHSWTHGIGRVNPNLYEDGNILGRLSFIQFWHLILPHETEANFSLGNICLSLLGTWHADQSSETWNPAHSTILQLLVSLMALVLVREPWYSTFPSIFCFELCTNIHIQTKPASQSTKAPKMCHSTRSCTPRRHTS